jgi:hypothetical protein
MNNVGTGEKRRTTIGASDKCPKNSLKILYKGCRKLGIRSRCEGVWKMRRKTRSKLA